jgi:hypothetical protein
VIGGVAIAGNARQDRSNRSECGHHFHDIELTGDHVDDHLARRGDGIRQVGVS